MVFLLPPHLQASFISLVVKISSPAQCVKLTVKSCRYMLYNCPNKERKRGRRAAMRARPTTNEEDAMRVRSLAATLLYEKRTVEFTDEDAQCKALPLMQPTRHVSMAGRQRGVNNQRPRHAELTPRSCLLDILRLSTHPRRAPSRSLASPRSERATRFPFPPQGAESPTRKRAQNTCPPPPLSSPPLASHPTCTRERHRQCCCCCCLR